MSMKSSQLINEEIERLMPLHRDDDGTMDDNEIANALADFVRAHLGELVDADSFARDRLANYQRHHGLFKRVQGGLQLALLNMDAVVQLGNNTSVVARDARRSHALARRELLRDQNQAQQVAFVREVTVWEEFLDRIKEDDDTFGDLMGKDYTGSD